MPRARTPLIITALALSAAAGALLRAGPLDPPAGPVAPTYKTLSEVEPRIAVNATNTPGTATALFRITQPGSYHLTGNIAGVAAKSGIEIAASDVTLDLEGYRLQGVASSLAGISITSGQTNVVIRNGTIRGFAGGGVSGAAATQCGIESVRAIGNTGNGIQLGSGATLKSCRCDSNTTAGISTSTDAVISDCTCRLNGSSGIATNDHSLVLASLSRGNTGNGLTLGAGNLVADDVVAQNAVGVSAGSGLNAVNTIARDNNSHGFFCFGGAYANCVATVNTGDGFNTDAAVITACRSTSNGGSGYSTGNNSLTGGCIAVSNGAFGVHCGTFGGYVTRNLCSSDCTTATELREIKFDSRGRADGNYLQSTNSGLWGIGGPSSTLMTNNYLQGGFVPTFGGWQGPVIDTSNIDTTCNPSGNYKN